MPNFNVLPNKLDFQRIVSAINFFELNFFTLLKDIVRPCARGQSISAERIGRDISELLYVSSSNRATSFSAEKKLSLFYDTKLATQGLPISKVIGEKCILKEDGQSEIEQRTCNIPNGLNYKSVVCYLSNYGDGDSIGGLILLSDLEGEDLRESLNQNLVSPYLNVLHFYFPRVSASLSKAIYNTDNIPQKTLGVLRLSFQGESSNAIGEKLHITTRGVEYHLVKAKRFLNAAIRVQLISLAKDCCLI